MRLKILSCTTGVEVGVRIRKTRRTGTLSGLGIGMGLEKRPSAIMGLERFASLA